MNRWRVILAAAVIFLAGAGTGGALVRSFAPRIVKRMHVSPPLPIGPDRREEYLSKLDHELQLTPEQRRTAEGILAASQKRMKEIWEPFEPQVKEEYRRTRREISEILTPAQQERMKQMRKDEHRGRDNGKPGNDKSDKGEKPEAQRQCTKVSCCV